MSSKIQPSLTQLFSSFLRLGLTAFGGPSMIAYIRAMAVDKKRWLDSETFIDGVALSQMIPGATAMQTAAYVGLKTRGVTGASVSYIGFGLPAFLMMMMFSLLYSYSGNLPLVVSAFSGLQAIIVAIIANATLSFGKTTLINWKTMVIASIAAGLFGLNTNPILVILLAGMAGFLLIRPKEPSTSQPISFLQAFPYKKAILLMLSLSATGFLLLFLFNKTLFSLAALMFRIDLFAFGGGFASVPLMLHEIVGIHHWMDAQTFMNGIVLGQVTPGPIVITATFVGYLLGGPLGGIIATMAIFLPSFMLLIGISPYFDRIRNSPTFTKFIGGVLCSFVGLLLTVTIRFALNVHWDFFHLLLGSSSFVALLLKVDILWVVVAGTIISVIMFI
ncbi:MAG: chromate efflux transporter [Proteobacteria bacterium]|nr:chromate efflux transporter [Pseudomonadota bacterium]